MTNGQNCYVFCFHPISRDVTTVSEIDQPFAELFRKIIHQAPDVRVAAEKLHALQNRLTSPPCRVLVFGPEELTKAL